MHPLPPLCWLASYPKSGSTWFRLLVSNAQAARGRRSGINALSDSGHIASSRVLWEEATLLDASLLRDHEIDVLRPAAHRARAAGTGGRAELVKCHDGYTFTARGEPMMGGSRAARGVVLLVRDPRDVAPSLAAHLNRSLDYSIDLMADPQASLGGQSVRGSQQLRQQLLSWSEHVTSWLDQTDLPLQLIRYEDLQTDAARQVRSGLRFAGIPTTVRRIHEAVAACCFERLQRQEAEQGFIEAPSQSRPFFRAGTSGQWRRLLTSDQVDRIEAAHGTVMRRLGYPLAGDDPSTR